MTSPNRENDFDNLLESWRKNLAERNELSLDDREELEDHLRMLVNEQVAAGVSEEVAFDKARQQLGEPDELAESWVRSPRATSSVAIEASQASRGGLYGLLVLLGSPATAAGGPGAARRCRPGWGAGAGRRRRLRRR